MTEQEPLDGLISKGEVKGAVTESKSETEAVTLARMKYDAHRFYLISGACIFAAFSIIIFLMFRYDDADADARGKMVAVFATIVSAALGIIVGRKT